MSLIRVMKGKPIQRLDDQDFADILEGERIALELFWRSIGLYVAPQPRLFALPQPQVKRITQPVLVMGEGAVCYVDKAELPRRLWDKKRKGYWNGLLIKNTLQR